MNHLQIGTIWNLTNTKNVKILKIKKDIVHKTKLVKINNNAEIKLYEYWQNNIKSNDSVCGIISRLNENRFILVLKIISVWTSY
jgi:hypothetical protein